ncbi:amino acid ABC transporter substrate-binding protein [Streptomyces sp. R302]|uniref:ABC transporter substrate-binding protein n=1 Tax=unclassified Streptomyces TaxID=2593676 RepID=UPI00145F0072|nr:MULTISPECIES: ABC transporter substrate-binding protein [unclassified Streptomyces]NML48983.1 amino acid ABC transporter substrate-binding protein [Streptomyces sp. R301]NML77310.1 amino acid ABC transporter substrate-binding protein [Streptomyces sp. R302]
MSTPAPLRIGVLAPLSRPGWTEAGRHLLAGLELAADEITATGGITAAGGVGGRPLELLVRDTAADPRRAEAAVDELAALGAVALAGEYHSVVARAAAARAEALGVPYLCSSAVIDALTDEPAERVARLAPVQSQGWRLYAEFLLAEGHTRLAVATEPGAYWAAGTRILREHLAPRGGTVTEFDARALEPAALADALAAEGATALLLLTGFPGPAVELVRAVRGAARRDPRLAGVLIGAPAGQPEFAEWAELLGEEAGGVPFLRYLPARPTPLGARVEAALRARLGAAPSFVAFEGYDTVTVLADALRVHGTDRAAVAGAWPRVVVEGTRGEIRFTRPSPSAPVWQWAGPVQVADRDPADPTRFRTLRVR